MSALDKKKSINGATAVVGVIGNPVSHSLSPIIHNSAFAACGCNAVYVPFLVNDIEDAVAGVRALGIRGVSVTIPFKQDVMKHLDAIDAAAEAVGAVNTVVNDNGRLTGYNTDGYGALRALKQKAAVENASVLVLGTGGSACGIAMTMLMTEKPVRLVVVGRTPEKSAAFAGMLTKRSGKPVEHCSFDGSDFSSRVHEADIIINTTPVGMHPEIDASPLSRDIIESRHTVFDIVYTPQYTKLLKYAREKRAAVVFGYEMLLHQAAVQFELWTKQAMPLGVARKALTAALKRRTHV
ncbi:MAG: shikimate dehydrogenase [Spirochaetes bacterium]|nr:shikimate dehydrogenase [Spirochaetota bacterium]